VTKRFLRPGSLFIVTLLLDVSARMIERGYPNPAFMALLDWSVIFAGLFYLAGHLLEYLEMLSVAATRTFMCTCSQLVVISVTARKFITVIKDSRLVETETCLCGSGKSFRNCCMKNLRDS
jgi:hypothetical protein